eukprot:2103190-Rhodomonas_salina.3
MTLATILKPGKRSHLAADRMRVAPITVVDFPVELRREKLSASALGSGDLLDRVRVTSGSRAGREGRIAAPADAVRLTPEPVREVGLPPAFPIEGSRVIASSDMPVTAAVGEVLAEPLDGGDLTGISGMLSIAPDIEERRARGPKPA